MKEDKNKKDLKICRKYNSEIWKLSEDFLSIEFLCFQNLYILINLIENKNLRGNNNDRYLESGKMSGKMTHLKNLVV